MTYSPLTCPKEHKLLEATGHLSISRTVATHLTMQHRMQSGMKATGAISFHNEKHCAKFTRHFHVIHPGCNT